MGTSNGLKRMIDSQEKSFFLRKNQDLLKLTRFFYSKPIYFERFQRISIFQRSAVTQPPSLFTLAGAKRQISGPPTWWFQVPSGRGTHRRHAHGGPQIIGLACFRLREICQWWCIIIEKIWMNLLRSKSQSLATKHPNGYRGLNLPKDSILNVKRFDSRIEKGLLGGWIWR